MPGRKHSLPDVRDALLVVMVATLAFALGVLASGFEDEDAAIRVSGAMRGSSGAIRTDPVLGPGAMSRSQAPFAPDRADVSRARPLLAPAPAPVPASLPAGSAERFSGEGAGRKNHIVASDPHNRRSYILDTASLMHRRGWIGLDERVAEATAGGIESPSRPAAQLGPR